MNGGRRDFLKTATTGIALAAIGGLAACSQARRNGHVVVIGGGFGGATAAKYLRLLSAGGIDVTLIERRPRFVSFPMSNRVISGQNGIEDITLGYDGLRKHGVRFIQGEAVAIDPARRTVRLADGGMLDYDRLVVAPGIDFLWGNVPGLSAEIVAGKLFHAWEAGPQTIALRRQIEEMPEGGVFAVGIPKTPYANPAAPYERACLVAHYCKQYKPRAKVLVFDANEDVQALRPQFMAAWAQLYPNLVEYRPGHPLSSIDLPRKIMHFEYHEPVTADVINLVPPQQAGAIARQAGLVTAGRHWCGVDWRTMESRAHPGIHVVGNATLAAAEMPKSAQMSNLHGKIAAAAIVALMRGRPAPQPMALRCSDYSFFDANTAARMATMHRYDEKMETYRLAPGAGGDSAARSEAEGKAAWAWVRDLWADTLL